MDWALSHWVHFTMHRFILLCILCPFFHTAYMSYYCNTVGSTWWDWRLILRTLSSFTALTLSVGSFYRQKSVRDMTYNVFGGTLDLTQLQLQPNTTPICTLHFNSHFPREHALASCLHWFFLPLLLNLGILYGQVRTSPTEPSSNICSGWFHPLPQLDLILVSRVLWCATLPLDYCDTNKYSIDYFKSAARKKNRYKHV